MKKILAITLFIIFSFTNFVKAENKTTYKLYYFMTDARCSTCYKIENYTTEAFKELNKNNLSFETLSINQKENEHFIKQYNLYTKSVVLSKMENGKEIKFKNLDKIWNNIGNKENFKEYIKNEITNFME